MKKLCLTLGFLVGIVISNYSFSQQSTFSDRQIQKYRNPDVKMLYKQTYELLDEHLLGTDSLILETLNLSIYEDSRLESQDVTVFDEQTQVGIIIYSLERSRKKTSRIYKP